MSWNQLVSMLQEARDIDAQEATTPPTACPNDGTPLKETESGGLFCPFDGWRP